MDTLTSRGKFPAWTTTQNAQSLKLATTMVARIGPKNPSKMRVFLREWRDYLGLTQEEIANRIGTTKGTISRMEGSSREPNLGYLAAFAEAVDRDVADLFRDPARPSRDELLRNASPEQLRQAIELIQSVRKTGTDGH
jgi:transcriptional regulator with XRE-family HTH domain